MDVARHQRDVAVVYRDLTKLQYKMSCDGNANKVLRTIGKAKIVCKNIHQYWTLSNNQ